MSHLGDTNSGPLPGDFPVGSLESRAAARSMLERTESNASRIVMRIEIVHIGTGADEPLPATQLVPFDGGMAEIVHRR